MGLDLSHTEGLVDRDMAPDPAQTWTEVSVSVEVASEVVEVLYEEAGAVEDIVRASVRTPSEVFMGLEGEREDTQDLEEEEDSRAGLELRTQDLNLILETWAEVMEGRRRAPRSPFPMTWRGRS